MAWRRACLFAIRHYACFYTHMNGTTVETQIERRFQCLLMSSAKIQKIMRKTRRSRGRNAEFYVIDVSPAAE
jgi:N-glycosylase/DNA lyase